MISATTHMVISKKKIQLLKQTTQKKNVNNFALNEASSVTHTCNNDNKNETKTSKKGSCERSRLAFIIRNFNNIASKTSSFFFKKKQEKTKV